MGSPLFEGRVSKQDTRVGHSACILFEGSTLISVKSRVMHLVRPLHKRDT